MTTAAIANGVVACDTQATRDNCTFRMCKLMRLPDGGVVTGAGMARHLYAAMQWLASGEQGEPPRITGATVVIVRPDKSIWIAEGGFPAFPIMDSEFCIGSGHDIARAALAAGDSPAEAVARACQLDLYSSGPVIEMAVESPPEFSGPVLRKIKQKRVKK